MPFQPKDVKFVKIDIPIIHDEEELPNNFPFRNNKNFSIVVKHPSGEIIDFPTNYTLDKEWAGNNMDSHQLRIFNITNVFNLKLKVTDCGVYTLLDADSEVLASIENDYVPNQHSIPGQYGDYIELFINLSDGSIENWMKNPSFKEFKGHE